MKNTTDKLGSSIIDAMHLDGEIFKQVKDFPLFDISNKGRLWNNKTQRFIGADNGYGYLGSRIYNDVCRKNKSIHALVAETFLEKPVGNFECDHIDRNKLNNSVENLRWVTRSQNGRNKDLNTSATLTILAILDMLEIECKHPKYSAYYRRLQRGWSVAKTLSTPIKQRKARR